MNQLHEHRLQSVTTTLRAAAASRHGRSATLTTSRRFVTISRQAGAGGKSLGQELARSINDRCPTAEPWCAWDHELVDKVAGEHHIRSDFIEALEDVDHHWFDEFMASLSSADNPSDFKVYQRVAKTIRALATAGNAVIVGRGGTFITAGMPGGIHVRLVAPLAYRIKRMADRLQATPAEAEVMVHETDRNRTAFYHRYWQSRQMSPETFTLTYNTADLSERLMVASLLPIIFDDEQPQ